MRAQQLVGRAREELEAGRYALANRSAWEAVQAAMLAQDEGPVREALGIAQDIASRADGGARDEAERLAAYCTALLEGVGGGVKAPSLLDRLFGRRTTEGRGSVAPRPTTDDGLAAERRPCPECGESIAAAAKLCRFCGHRLAPS